MTKSVKPSFAIVVLAAGQSTRLGQMKQLIDFKNISLIEFMLRQALTVTDNVYCVLGCNEQQVQARIDHLPIKTIINHNWSDGMASSIATGVAALAPETSAVMILLVDQWQLRAEDLNQHRSYWRDNPHAIIVAQKRCESSAEKNEKIGPPVIFPKRYFDELTQLNGEKGAKALLSKYSHKLLKLELSHAFIDLDTPEHLEQLQKSLHM